MGSEMYQAAFYLEFSNNANLLVGANTGTEELCQHTGGFNGLSEADRDAQEIYGSEYKMNCGQLPFTKDSLLAGADEDRLTRMFKFPIADKTFNLHTGSPCFVANQDDVTDITGDPAITGPTGMKFANLKSLFRCISFTGFTAYELVQKEVNRGSFEIQPYTSSPLMVMWVDLIFGDTIPYGTRLYIDVPRTMDEVERLNEYMKRISLSKQTSSQYTQFIMRPSYDQNLTSDCINANMYIPFKFIALGHREYIGKGNMCLQQIECK
jgi:hypothetical protein